MIKEDEKKYFTVRKFEIGEDTPYMAPVSANLCAIMYQSHFFFPAGCTRCYCDHSVPPHQVAQKGTTPFIGLHLRDDELPAQDPDEHGEPCHHCHVQVSIAIVVLNS